MTVTARGIQADRDVTGKVPESFGPVGGTYYFYRRFDPVVSAEESGEGAAAVADDLPAFEVIASLEEAGHFEYLRDEEEDLYTSDDGEPVD